MNGLHFDNITPIRRVRARDPLTSVVAAEKVGRFANSQAARILHAIRAIKADSYYLGGNEPANQNTIAKMSGLSPAAVGKRLGEMGEAGLIAVEQQDGANRVVNGQRCWVAVNA